MSQPFLSCLCPTYRRPQLLANAVACFLAQDYPADRRELIILDDAGQFEPSSGPGWRLISQTARVRSLPEKYNALAGLAQGDHLVVWEDDDIYLPWHLTAHASVLAQGEYSKPTRVLSRSSNRGFEEECADGRFHGSIAFSRGVFESVRGWPLTRRADFDLQFMAQLASLAASGDPCQSYPPSYIFRWGSTNAYHAQYAMQAASDDTWYQRCKDWGDGTSRLQLRPALDSETRRTIRSFERPRVTVTDVVTATEPAFPVGSKNSDRAKARIGRQATNISLLIPTTGRSSLRRTLESIRPQLADGDEVLLLSDGPVDSSLRDLWSDFDVPGQLVEVPDGPHRDWGHTPRNFALPQAGCPYVMHLDDDDILAPNALKAIRRAILADPGAFFVFRMRYADGRTLWRAPALIPDNVGTPMFVHPREIPYGQWAPFYGGDHAFIRETIALSPQRPVRWRTDVVALIGAYAEAAVPIEPAESEVYGPIFDLGGVGAGGGGCTTVNVGAPADISADITDLDTFVPDDRTVRQFHLTHTLEHIPNVKYADFLRGMYRKLTPGGSVHVVQSDAGAAIRQWCQGDLSFRAMRTVLFTPADRIRINPYHAHFNMWSAEELARDFESVGFETRIGNAGTWSFDMIDELVPEGCLPYHGTPIRNLHVIATKPRDRVPNHLHFVFGLRPDFGGRPFSLIHYLALRSAVMVNRPDKVTLWYAHEPQGRWWEMACELAERRTIDAFDSFHNVPREHYAHRADVARLQILYDYGGIYLDLDTICVKPFGDLGKFPCVMGWEDINEQNLCNAVILAERKSAFVEMMLEAQREFQPGMWGEISIRRSGELAHQHPGLIHTLDREAFYWPSWQDGGYELLTQDGNTEFPKAICHHLWEHAYWDRGLKNITIADLRSGESPLCQIVEPFLDGLID